MSVEEAKQKCGSLPSCVGFWLDRQSSSGDVQFISSEGGGVLQQQWDAKCYLYGTIENSQWAEMANRQNPEVLKHCSRELQQDGQFVKRLVSQNGRALEFAADNHKKDIEIVQ